MKATAVLVLFCFLGCSVGPDPGREPFRFNLENAGKADGEPVLAREDLQRIAEAFDLAIKQAEAEIARFQVEIRKLEDGNRLKQAEIDSLVSRIAARKAEVERNRNRAILAAGVFGLLTFGWGAVAGAAAVSSLAVALANDSKLQELQRSLQRAETEQEAIRAKVKQTDAQKRALEAQLASIRSSKTKLVAALESPESIAPPESLRDYADALMAHRRIKLLEAILSLTRQEIDALTQIRSPGQGVARGVPEGPAGGAERRPPGGGRGVAERRARRSHARGPARARTPRRRFRGALGAHALQRIARGDPRPHRDAGRQIARGEVAVVGQRRDVARDRGQRRNRVDADDGERGQGHARARHRR